MGLYHGKHVCGKTMDGAIPHPMIIVIKIKTIILSEWGIMSNAGQFISQS